MKLNRIISLCAVTATLALNTFAQENPPPGGGDQGNGQRRNRQAGGNGGGPGGSGGQGGRGWGDPAQMQQMFVDGARDRLNFTNDTEWAAVEPLVKKVIAARMDVGTGGMRGMMGGRNRGGNNGDQAGNNNRPRGGFGGQTSPEQEALQKALEDSAPAAQIKELLAKYKAAQKAKQTKLEAAQTELKAVLDTRQEAEAVLIGLVN
jgi:hypothetical protein